MKTVLVVDDDASVRETLVEMLERMGFSVLGADSGSAAMALLQETDVDLLLTDIIMPGKEGLETIMEIRGKRPELPIIAISGGGERSNFSYLKVARFLGAADTLPKPIRFDRLAQSVHQVLETYA